MNRTTRTIKLVIERKPALLLSALVIILIVAGRLASQQLTVTATYPIPAGVYNQIVTTGNSGTTPADTTLNRNAGNTFLVPPTNPNGKVGIGTTVPYWPLSVAGAGSFVSPNMGTSGGVIIRDAAGDPNAAFLQFTNNAETLELGHIQGLKGGGLSMMGGNVGIGTTTPASALSVNGGVQIGGDGAACTSAKTGTERWNGSSGQVEICDGANWGPLGGAGLYYYARSWNFQWAACVNAAATCPGAYPNAVGGGTQCSGGDGSYATYPVGWPPTGWAGYCCNLCWQVWGGCGRVIGAITTAVCSK